MPGIWRRLAEMVRSSRLDRELDDEVNCHLEMLEEQFRARGMSAAEARAAALREFGGVAHAKEIYRKERGLPWLETTARDVRYALRGLRRSPGFAAAAVLSLGLGIGANTAIFSLFHALMLRLLPVAHPEELVNFYQTGGWINGYSSYPLYQEMAKHSDLFSGVLARSGAVKVRFREQSAARENFAVREFVSGNYFQVLGVKPAFGRLFTPDDDRIPGGHPLAVLSYDCWRTRFAADPSAVGAVVMVDEKPLTVVGVSAPGFRGVEVEKSTEIWIPLTMAGMNLNSPSAWWLQIVARVRSGIPRKQLAAAVSVVMQQHLVAAYPSSTNGAFRKHALEQRLAVRDAGIGLSMLREEFAQPLRVLMAAVGLVLLMACANVANLLLARGAARRKEAALRFSLGATRLRLIRQALTESFLLGVAGAALGVGLGIWGAEAFQHFLPEQAGDPLRGTPEPAVLAFTIAISLGSVLLFGLVPALRFTTVHPAAGLRTQTGGSEGSPLLRRTLVVAQVAFSVVLVAMAALFGRSLFALRSVDLGFHNQNVIAFNLDFPHEWHPRNMHMPLQQLAERLQALPGVALVSYGLPGPFQMGTSTAALTVPGSERTAGGPVDVATAHVAPRYFETIGTPLLLGREFDRNDSPTPPQVAVVNEAFVSAFLRGESFPDRRTLSFDDVTPTRIVGVVRDIRQDGIQKEAKPTVYLPADEQQDPAWQTMLVRSQLPPAALLPWIYRETARLGSSIVVQDLGTLGRHVDDSIFEQRLLAAFSGFFGALALLLAAVGLYGVVAYGTAGRTGEIGVRISLGARRGQVLWMVLRGALSLVLTGLAIGLFASLIAAKAVSSILFGIQPSDPLAFGFTALALSLTGLAAAFLPARRAASIDPLRALRNE